MSQMRYTCKRCGHTWIRRVLGKIPDRCPDCKSPYWNDEYSEKWLLTLEKKRIEIAEGRTVADKWYKILRMEKPQ